MKYGVLFLVFNQLLFFSCIQKNLSDDGVVRVRLDEFPDTFNPVTSKTQEAEMIFHKVYEFGEKLGDVTNDVFPWVVQFQSVKDSGDYKIYRFRIREEAKWDIDRPIQSNDIETTLKIINLPGIDNQRVRLQYSFIKGVRVFADDSALIEILALGSRESLRPKSGQFIILPTHVYDPNGFLIDLKLEEIIENYEALKEDSRVLKYAEFFNSEQLKTELIKGGSGPYHIVNWTEGSSVTVEKDEDWWGFEIDDKENHLRHYPQKIEYQPEFDSKIGQFDQFGWFDI